MRYFKIQELVSPEILEVLSEEAAWRLIPDPVRRALDTLRGDFGSPIHINGAYKGKVFKYSGVRPIKCEIGATFSTHKMIYPGKMAFDLKCSDQGKLRKLILEKYKTYGIIRVEDFSFTKTWTHAEFSWGEVPVKLDIFKP